MGYSHFNILERENLMLWFYQGLSISKIAEKLTRNKSSVLRELKRNSLNGNYIACLAQENYLSNRKKSKRHKLLDEKTLCDFIANKFLNLHWSPEQIVERSKLETGSFPVSFTTIYRRIYDGNFNKYRNKYGLLKATTKLRHKGKKRHKKAQMMRKEEVF